METLKHLQEIKKVYDGGGNIIKYIKSLFNRKETKIEDILIAYDFQSGSYLKTYSEYAPIKHKYHKKLREEIEAFAPFESILEVGVGEGTTLVPLLSNLKMVPSKIFGLDISWSRLKFARHFAIENGYSQINFLSANLFNIPLPDNSIDIVFTSHALEPNGGQEQKAIKELYRVAKKAVILLEPAYEFANQEGKDRMDAHGYIKDLAKNAHKLGIKEVDHRPFEISLNPLNPTGITILKKHVAIGADPTYTCPISGKNLIRTDIGTYFSPEGLLTYPIVDEIACLLKNNAILTSNFETDYEAFKKQHNINIDLKNQD